MAEDRANLGLWRVRRGGMGWGWGEGSGLPGEVIPPRPRSLCLTPHRVVGSGLGGGRRRKLERATRCGGRWGERGQGGGPDGAALDGAACTQ